MQKKISIIIVLSLIIVLIFLSSQSYTKDTHENNTTNWQYYKNEYPKSEYTLDEIPVSHKSAYEIRQFFEDSDTNHDGILKEEEINNFDYKIKHSQYTFNGPYGYN